MSKFLIVETLGHIAGKAVRVHSGQGAVRAMPVAEGRYRDVRVMRICEGANEDQWPMIAH